MWFIIARCARAACPACSSFRRSAHGFRNDDLYLRSWEWGESLGERNVVVPARNDRDARGAAAHRELAVPATHIIARAVESLPAAAVAEPTHAADHRFFERRRVVPAR